MNTDGKQFVQENSLLENVFFALHFRLTFFSISLQDFPSAMKIVL